LRLPLFVKALRCLLSSSPSPASIVAFPMRSNTVTSLQLPD
jgi:hypothetical protein